MYFVQLSAMTDDAIIVDSPKQASQIFEQPVASRSSLSVVLNIMCQNFHLVNFGVKSNFTCEKLLRRLNYKKALSGTVRFERKSTLEASLR